MEKNGRGIRPAIKASASPSSARSATYPGQLFCSSEQIALVLGKPQSHRNDEILLFMVGTNRRANAFVFLTAEIKKDFWEVIDVDLKDEVMTAVRPLIGE